LPKPSFYSEPRGVPLLGHSNAGGSAATPKPSRAYRPVRHRLVRFKPSGLSYGALMKRLCLTLVVAMGAMAGCGGGSQSAAPVTAAPTATVVPSTTGSSVAPQAGGQVPAILSFTGSTLDGAAFDGASLAGKPTVFWFWAPWCPKCQAEGPAVAKAAQKYQNRVTVVGVAGLDRSTEKMTEFVDRTGTSGMAHLDDRTGALYKHFRVTSQSSYLFVNADGDTESATGPLNEDRLSSLIERHLL
jgi:thiol-disulfide isomerase/thioredoxin